MLVGSLRPRVSRPSISVAGLSAASLALGSGQVGGSKRWLRSAARLAGPRECIDATTAAKFGKIEAGVTASEDSMAIGFALGRPGVPEGLAGCPVPTRGGSAGTPSDASRFVCSGETGFARRVSWMLVGLIAAVWWAMWRGWAILRSDVERKPWDI